MADMMRCVTCMNFRGCEPEGIIKTSKACNEWQPRWNELGEHMHLFYKCMLRMTDEDYRDLKLWWQDRIEISTTDRKVSKDLKMVVKLVDDDKIDVNSDEHAYIDHFFTEANIIRVKLKEYNMKLDFDKTFIMPLGKKKFKVKIISADINGVNLLSKEGTDFTLTYSTVRDIQQTNA